MSSDKQSFSFFFKIFLMWTIFDKSLLNLLQYYFYFYALDFWLQGMWEFSSPTRDQTHIPCTGRWSLDLRQRGPKCAMVKVHSCVWWVCFSYSLSDLFGKSGTRYRSRRCSSGRRFLQSPRHRCHTSCLNPVGWLCGLLLTQMSTLSSCTSLSGGPSSSQECAGCAWSRVKAW